MRLLLTLSLVVFCQSPWAYESLDTPEQASYFLAAMDYDQKPELQEKLLEKSKRRKSRNEITKKRRKARSSTARRKGKRAAKPLVIKPTSPQKKQSIKRILSRLNERKFLSRNQMGVELGGKALTYSLFYERMVGSQAALGIGYGYQELNINPLFGKVKVSVTTLPLYAQYYFQRYSHRLSTLGGVTMLQVDAGYTAKIPSDMVQTEDQQANQSINNALPSELQVGAGATIPVAMTGVGYEYRTMSGFIFRTNIYGFLYPIVKPHFGLSFGGHF